ncbi:MAG: ROK family protein [Candidatus Sulfotelmatobacter sp.]
MSETQSPQAEAVAIGVDIGATTIKAALVGLRGDLLASFREDSPRTTSSLRDFVHSVRKRATVPVVGIGIGCKGVIDAATTRVNRLPGDLNFLEGYVLRELAGVDGLPLCADNDARTALVGEVLWGAARGRRNVVLLTLGTGVGAAALVDGVIVRGASGAACHLGHVTLDIRGGLCICGNYGCLETCFSSRAIESAYFAHIHRASPARLSLDDAGGVPSTEAIFQAATEGDPSARRVLDLAFESLTAALVSFLHVFDPELLILGGNIAAAGPQLLAPLHEEVARRTSVLLGRKVPIVLQETGGYGGVAGAAGLVFLQQRLLTI